MQHSPYLVPFDGTFSISAASTTPEFAPKKKDAKKELRSVVRDIARLQRTLYAQDQYSLLLVFQAMDAAGKDSTIRAVTSGVNPAGFQVFSFKAPSKEELDHDFLWRTAKRLPERGRIGIFNRSYYEETLVVRVHPEYLKGQRIPEPLVTDDIWEERFESIRSHEQHLVRNGTVILKFWLNVSHQEQRRRFVSRLEDAEKNWKFSSSDLTESALWDQYMEAYESMLNATSRRYAPWFAIPADDKPFMRITVAQIIRETLEGLDLAYPTPSAEDRAELARIRETLID